MIVLLPGIDRSKRKVFSSTVSRSVGCCLVTCTTHNYWRLLLCLRFENNWMLSRYMHNTQLLAASAVLEVRKQLTYISTVTLKCDIGLKHTSMHWAKGNRHLFLTRCVGLNFGDVSGVVTNWNTLPIRASSQTTFNSLIDDELTFKTFSIMINTLHMKFSRLVKLNTGQILCVNSAT